MTHIALSHLQIDRHLAEMTVRETLAFGARMRGQGFGGDGELGIWRLVEAVRLEYYNVLLVFL